MGLENFLIFVHIFLPIDVIQAKNRCFPSFIFISMGFAPPVSPLFLCRAGWKPAAAVLRLFAADGQVKKPAASQEAAGEIIPRTCRYKPISCR